MKHLRFSSLLTGIILISLLLTGVSPARTAQAQPPQGIIGPYATTITVNSTADPDNSDSTTCATDPCTLRRAVIQARGAVKPVLINFNIPTSDAGYNGTLQIWKIQFSGISATTNAALRYLNGEITIDGTTQPNGRTSGPKIILVGSGTGAKDGIKLGESATQNSNILRGLGFQNFATHVYVNSQSNTIEGNWFGLNDDGSGAYLRNADPEDGSGSAGVAISTGTSLNTVQSNIFLAFDGVAIALRGSENLVQNNWIGTNASGVVPIKQTEPGLLCSIVDWLGGGGISMDGPDHIVQGNTIAGLRQHIFISSSQPDAITVQSTCDSCLVKDNIIGKDVLGHEVGVCGQGIDISNTESVILQNNLLVDTFHAAIFINGALSTGNTLKENLILRSTPWILPDGATKADDAILRYSGLPDAYEFFNPAIVTSVSGTTVSGTAGASSPCPNCVIELFLDDADSINEALVFLGTTTANSSGNWTFTMAAPLPYGMGIRTTSTTAQFNTIPNLLAGTTVGLSPLYAVTYALYLPAIRR